MVLRLAAACLAGLICVSSLSADWRGFLEWSGCQFLWDPARQAGLLSRPDHTLGFRPGFDQAILDGTTVTDLPGISLREGNLELSASAEARLREIFPRAVRPGEHWRIGAIVIDPGHGGSDPGSSSTHQGPDGTPFTLTEKDLTLAVGLDLYQRLKAACPDRQILLTRHGDVYPTLEDRVTLAHGIVLQPREIVLFLSLHFNASLNPKAAGLEVWYIPRDFQRDVAPDKIFPDADPAVLPVINALMEEELKRESKRFAERIGEGLLQAVDGVQDNRGLKENPWYVVRNARMPAVLAELGFLTNAAEAGKIRNPEYLKKLALGLYNGLLAYISDYEEKK